MQPLHHHVEHACVGIVARVVGAHQVRVHEIDADGPGSIVDVNDLACELLGYSREELLGMHIGDIDVKDSSARIQPKAGACSDRPVTGRAVRIR